MCREAGAVKHDDRVDALAQGVRYFTDAVALSASKLQAQRKHEEWYAMQYAFENYAQQATDALATGRSFKALKTQVDTGVYEW